MWHVRHISLAAALLAACSIVAALASPPTHAASLAQSSTCSSSTGSLSSIRRVAADIRAAGGNPTTAGTLILNAAKTGDVEGVGNLFAPTQGDGFAVGSFIVATGAKPVVSAAMPSGGAVTTQGTGRETASARGTSSPKDWSSPQFYSCGFNITANIVWYCKQGSSQCQTRWYFGFHSPVSTPSGSCPSVNRYACQVYAYASPGANDYVTEGIAYQSLSGSPVIGDKWCG